MEPVHTPVLLEETIECLAPRSSDDLLIDATLGEGGHSAAFLSRFPTLRVVGVDADPAIQAAARERLAGFGGRIRFHTGWAQEFFAGYAGGGVAESVNGLPRPSAILIDLGVSLFHYERGGRGFSFRRDEPLDMRIDTGAGQGAAALLAGIDERRLADLLYANAGERASRRIARAIVEARARGTIRTSAALAGIVERAVGWSGGKIHPATKTFQALRVAVNGELERLPALLEGALKALRPGGRLAVITFDSNQDRIVKRFFQGRTKSRAEAANTPICREGAAAVVLLSRKGVTPGADEIRANPASRSARLRAVEKVLEFENNDA